MCRRQSRSFGCFSRQQNHSRRRALPPMLQPKGPRLRQPKSALAAARALLDACRAPTATKDKWTKQRKRVAAEEEAEEEAAEAEEAAMRAAANACRVAPLQKVCCGVACAAHLCHSLLFTAAAVPGKGRAKTTALRGRDTAIRPRRGAKPTTATATISATPAAAKDVPTAPPQLSSDAEAPAPSGGGGNSTAAPKGSAFDGMNNIAAHVVRRCCCRKRSTHNTLLLLFRAVLALPARCSFPSNALLPAVQFNVFHAI